MEKTVYQLLQECRVELQNKNLKKSGKNKFAGFDYFELKDFLPTINEMFNQKGLFSNFSIDDTTARLTITNGKDFIDFTSPIADANVKGCTPIQSLGAVHTYMKRYLYLNALEIVEADMLDAQVGKLEIDLISDEQKETIKNMLGAETIKSELKQLNKSKLSDLTKQEASELITKAVK